MIEIQGEICLSRNEKQNIHKSVKQKLESSLKLVKDSLRENIVNNILLPDYSRTESYDIGYELIEGFMKMNNLRKYDSMVLSSYYSKSVN